MCDSILGDVHSCMVLQTTNQPAHLCESDDVVVCPGGEDREKDDGFKNAGDKLSSR